MDTIAALHRFAMEGDTVAVRRLIAEGIDVNARDPQGNTALILAVKALHRDTVEALLELGADVNALNSKGSTALRRAAARANVDILAVLLMHGADPNLRKAGDYYNDQPAIHLAAVSGSVECVRLLLDHGADIDLRDTQLDRTALLAALDTDIKPEVAKFLIERGADVNARDNIGDTPLMEAQAYGCDELAQLLRQAGAVE